MPAPKQHSLDRTGPIADQPEALCYRAMLRRCYNKNHETYPYYGGRGIEVCGRWRKSFWDFLADVGTRPSLEHSLERIDNSGNYEPRNVRWATRREQALNRRPRRRGISDVLVEVSGDWKELSALRAASARSGFKSGSVSASLARLVRLGEMEKRGARGNQEYRATGRKRS